MTLRAVLLDFDGLICDTEQAAFQSWAELYASYGLRFTAPVWARMAGRRDGERVALADLSERLGAPVADAVRQGRLRRKHELCQGQALRPGVARLLRDAARHGLKRAVVSSSSRSWVEPHLVRLGVRDLFGDLVVGDLVERHKPAPDLYHLALRRLDVAGPEALAFEDSPTGVRAARGAGLRCVAVPNAVCDAADLGEADLVMDTLDHFHLESELLGLEGTVRP